MKKQTFEPAGGSVLVQPIEAEDMTAGGLALPDMARKDEVKRARVLAVGAGRLLECGLTSPMPCRVGDVVGYYAPHGERRKSGTELQLNGERLLILEEGEIMGVFGEAEQAALSLFEEAALAR